MPPMAERLRERYGDRARIITGDGTDTGMPADEFSSVVSFTMLHHVPTAALQDRLFAEAFRVLRPGGVFAGSDGVHVAASSACCTSATRATPSSRRACRIACGRPGLATPTSRSAPAGCAGAR